MEKQKEVSTVPTEEQIIESRKKARELKDSIHNIDEKIERGEECTKEEQDLVYATIDFTIKALEAENLGYEEERKNNTIDEYDFGTYTYRNEESISELKKINEDLKGGKKIDIKDTATIYLAIPVI